MHEVALCQSTVDIIEQQAKLNAVTRVSGVWLEIGALSCIEEGAFRFCFDIACRGTVAEGCRLGVGIAVKWWKSKATNQAARNVRVLI